MRWICPFFERKPLRTRSEELDCLRHSSLKKTHFKRRKRTCEASHLVALVVALVALVAVIRTVQTDAITSQGSMSRVTSRLGGRWNG